MIIHLAKKNQIVFLNIKETLRDILPKYLDFVDIFLKKLVLRLFKYLGITSMSKVLKFINKYFIIKYILKSRKLKIFQNNIDTYLA